MNVNREGNLVEMDERGERKHMQNSPFSVTWPMGYLAYIHPLRKYILHIYVYA